MTTIACFAIMVQSLLIMFLILFEMVNKRTADSIFAVSTEQPGAPQTNPVDMFSHVVTIPDEELAEL